MNIVFTLIGTSVPDQGTDTWKSISAHSGDVCLTSRHWKKAVQGQNDGWAYKSRAMGRAVYPEVVKHSVKS